MRNVRYEELLPHQIVEAREACPIAYMGIGGVEWHGEHNCVGLDTVKANELAIRCAEAAGGLRFPPLFYGENREAYLMETNHDPEDKIKQKMGLPPENFKPGYMGRPVQEQDRAYIELLLHIMREFKSLGFKVITLIPGHYPLLNHANAACEWFNVICRPTKAWAASGYDLVRAEIPDAGDHAAKWETSLMMAMRPELVDMSRLPEDLDEPLIGVGGIDPRREASAEYGAKGVEAVVKAITARTRHLLGSVEGQA